VLHWRHGAGGRGVLFSSDIANVIFPFMRSYPNLIPLSQKQVYAIGAALAPLEFDTICGHFFDRVIAGGGKDILARSIERYANAINGAYDVSAAREGNGAT
jgi:hypothetical protein